MQEPPILPESKERKDNHMQMQMTAGGCTIDTLRAFYARLLGGNYD